MSMEGGGRITEPCRMLSQDCMCERALHTAAGHGRQPQAREFRHLVQKEANGSLTL